MKLATLPPAKRANCVPLLSPIGGEQGLLFYRLKQVVTTMRRPLSLVCASFGGKRWSRVFQPFWAGQ